MPLSKTYTQHMLYRHTPHSGTHHSHRICAHTAKGLTTSFAAQLRALGPARPVLSRGHRDRWMLAGSQTLSLNGWAPPCCHLLRAWARIPSSFAQPAVPSWCPVFPPCHPLPPYRSYLAPFPQRPRRTKLKPRVPSARSPTGPKAAASPPAAQGAQAGLPTNGLPETEGEEPLLACTLAGAAPLFCERGN